MAMTTQSMNQSQPKEDPTGEMRLDSEGKGYWHSFKNDKKKKIVEEPKVEEPKVEEEEVHAPKRGRK